MHPDVNRTAAALTGISINFNDAAAIVMLLGELA
jgi:hypothetical protein